MKKKYLIIVIVLMIFAVGCNNKESTAFKEGQTALENHEYDKAKKYLSDVLEQDSKMKVQDVCTYKLPKCLKQSIIKIKDFTINH
ncbi:MAG: hypothetical protein V8S33_14915 [Intestinibacter bartlettii]